MREKKSILELTTTTCEDYRRRRKRPLILLCDNVRSLHNVGSFFRTCDAFLVEEIVLCGITGTPPHGEISKTALGAERSVAWRYAEDALSEAERLRGAGYELLVLEQAHDSISLGDFRVRPDGRYVLVVGNEVDGVSQGIVDIADSVLEIRQHGIKHSLNVSVSAGIALWSLSEQLSADADI
ncbi:MAG: RNA methyltransferase [Bacteroidales bacterium]|nr:RNA methyltransferase [Bacteroidales bacterium]MBD5221707.1 RNA methyltransferase [Bacteroidales bacterium]